MLRLPLLFVVSLALVPVAHATLAPRQQPSQLGQRLAREVIKDDDATNKNDQLVITDKTEIKLDGRLCKYEEVPGNAEIILLEVGSDRKAILKLHFQTKK